MNRSTLIGRLTKDPKFETVGQNNTPKASFNVAIDRPYKDSNGERGTDFVPVVCWSKLAENVNQYLSKGRLVGVEGSIRVDSFQDKQNNNRTWIEVRAQNVEFLDKASNNNNNGGNNQNYNNQNNRNNQSYNRNNNQNQNYNQGGQNYNQAGQSQNSPNGGYQNGQGADYNPQNVDVPF